MCTELSVSTSVLTTLPMATFSIMTKVSSWGVRDTFGIFFCEENRNGMIRYLGYPMSMLASKVDLLANTNIWGRHPIVMLGGPPTIIRMYNSFLDLWGALWTILKSRTCLPCLAL